LIITTTDGGNNWNQVSAANIPAPLPGEFVGITGEGGTSVVVIMESRPWFSKTRSLVLQGVSMAFRIAT